MTPTAKISPEAMRLWRSIRDKPPEPFRLHGVDLHPPESRPIQPETDLEAAKGRKGETLLDQAWRNLPPDDDWDRALEKTGKPL